MYFWFGYFIVIIVLGSDFFEVNIYLKEILKELEVGRSRGVIFFWERWFYKYKGWVL